MTLPTTQLDTSDVVGNQQIYASTEIARVAIINTFITACDAQCVLLTGNQTLAGVKTFSSFPVTPSSAPTTDYQSANKKYVDDNVGSYTPATQAGTNESNGEITLPNGLQLKWGHKSINAATTIILTFASETDVTAFSNACFTGWGISDGVVPGPLAIQTSGFTATTMTITNAGEAQVIHWFARGR